MGVTNYYSVDGEIYGERAGTGARTDYQRDALGSVTGTTDSAGVVVNTYRHKPYGTQLAKTGVGADPKFLWVGILGYRKHKLEVVDYYVRGRTYNPASATWVTKVILRYFLLGERSYTYAGNNPTTFTDKSGLAPCGRWWPLFSPCMTYPGGICEYAKHVQADQGDDGGVVCCDHMKVVCDWSSFGYPGLHKCVKEHEKTHLDDIDCPIWGFARPNFKGGLNSAKEECDAFRVDFDCSRDEVKKDCSKLPRKEDCLREYLRYTCYNCQDMAKNCGLGNFGLNKYGESRDDVCAKMKSQCNSVFGIDW